MVTPLGLHNVGVWSSINLNLWRKEIKARRDISDGESHSRASDDGGRGQCSQFFKHVIQKFINVIVLDVLASTQFRSRSVHKQNFLLESNLINAHDYGRIFNLQTEPWINTLARVF